jgi:hypothetical protein
MIWGNEPFTEEWIIPTDDSILKMLDKMDK